ncbi:hypothetical protein CaCOL14_010680 [Colletotrichum acutatum]
MLKKDPSATAFDDVVPFDTDLFIPIRINPTLPSLPASSPFTTNSYFLPYTLPTSPFQPTITMTVTKASTCCGKSAECVCAQQATCSCGKQSALHCTCSKAASENAVAGPRCSCRARPVGECTCDRAATENTKPSGETCSCGSRPADACTCDKAATTTYDRSEHEIDFTTRQ